MDYVIGVTDDDDSSFDVHRAIGLGVIVALPLCFLYAAVYSWIGFTVGAYISLAIAPGILLALMAIRFRVPIFVIVNLLNIFITGALTGLAIFSGGVTSPVIPWLVVPIVFAFWGHGPLLGTFWGGFGVMIVATLFWADRFQMIPETMLTGDARQWADVFGKAGFLLFYSALSWVLYVQRNKAVTMRDELLSDRQGMVQAMAHDLKNPVAGMVSRIYLMERRKLSGQPADSNEVCEAIKKDASAVLETIDRMLILNRSKTVRRAPRLEVCDLRQLLEDASALHKQWMDAKSIVVDMSAIIATRVIGDRELLAQPPDSARHATAIAAQNMVMIMPEVIPLSFDRRNKI